MIAPPPPPPPPIEFRASEIISGDRLNIDGEVIQGTWRWVGPSQGPPKQLWLPLDLLVARLGFRQSIERSGQQLQWYGGKAALKSLPKITIADEVTLNVAHWLTSTGAKVRRRNSTLSIEFPTAQITRLRRGKGSMASRLVLDLTGPALLQRVGNDMLLNLEASERQKRQLQQLGLSPRFQTNGLRLVGQAENLSSLTLNKPWRIVLDGVGNRSAQASLRSPLLNQSIQALIRRGLVMDSKVVKIGVKPLQINRVGSNPQAQGLQLRPLPQRGKQQGLRFLNQLAQPAGAVIAINGGFFNRVRQLPLGAVRLDGTWISGPILNRGAIGWGEQGQLSFGRLRLDQELLGPAGQRWPLHTLNSGYVQRGFSRYTSAWGPIYQALSGEEEAMMVIDGKVTQTYGQAQLTRGIPLKSNGDLVVARGGIPIPVSRGDAVSLRMRSSNPLGDLPQVLGGGPLLIKNGRVVLAGRQEGFSPGFLALSAPRTVVGQGNGKIWLLTIKGAKGSDPTLLETCLALQQLGLRDGLNLDGGSSTALLVANQLVMTGRGTPPRVQNGLGLIPL
ncbi:MAG: phosphodiester glycosidase family protein [Prochlorococcaceae cyanobacterium ETNP18_MAG_1]|nr:phosphodiester glycosidase family protein [Prochlorococcaceae cyanobacterium ETNP18_MAG_1]